MRCTSSNKTHPTRTRCVWKVDEKHMDFSPHPTQFELKQSGLQFWQIQIQVEPWQKKAL
jgi:hypothetical protein